MGPDAMLVQAGGGGVSRWLPGWRALARVLSWRPGQESDIVRPLTAPSATIRCPLLRRAGPFLARRRARSIAPALTGSHRPRTGSWGRKHNRSRYLLGLGLLSEVLYGQALLSYDRTNKLRGDQDPQWEIELFGL